MGAIATFSTATVGVPATLLRDPPTTTITSPIGTVTTSTITVNWTYFSQLSRPQKNYRLILTDANNQLLFETGIVGSAATSNALAYTLTPFVTYKLFLGVNDGFDGNLADFETFGGFTVFRPGWAGSTFFTEFSALTVYPDNFKVGSIYEIAINGVGYMLEDDPERPVQFEVAQLQPERFATGDTPFSEAIDRYTYMGFADWRAGAGQLYRDRPNANESRYWYSERVDPFTVGQVSCLNQFDNLIVSTYAPSTSTHQAAVTAGGSIYVTTSPNQLTARDSPGGTNTAFSSGFAGTILDLASDGTFWYATDGANIRRNNAAADPGANWSTEDVTEIEWCSDRIMGIDNVAAPRELLSFSTAGVGTVIATHPEATLRGICGGDGHVWYGKNIGDTGEVRFWKADSSPTVLGIALTLPAGELVDNVYFYLGNVFLAARTEDKRIKIYRCAPSAGLLTPQFITEANGLPNNALGYQVQFAGIDRFVAFSWFTMQRSFESGIGVVDLETGGYARWNPASTTVFSQGREIIGVARWDGQFAVVTSGTNGGLWSSDATPAAHTGFIETSVSDLASNVTKVLHDVKLTTQPLNGTVEVLYSPNSNATFTSVGTMSGAGVTTASFPVGVFGSSFGFRLVLTPSGGIGPIVKLVQGRTYPQGITDELVVMPINCADQLVGLNDHVIQEDSGVGKGIRRVRTLQTLCGQLVKLQPVDWPQTHQSQTFQLVSARSDLVGQIDRNKNFRTDHGVCVVTLRRPSD